MTQIVSLPNELLAPIVGHLRDRRIHFFDPVATKDLQSVRLVCRRMLAIATPMLFENMVYDLKLWREEEITRLAKFAQCNPEIANYVHRLQIKLPPSLPRHDVYELEEEPCCMIELDRVLREMEGPSGLWTQAHTDQVFGLLLPTVFSWGRGEDLEWHRFEQRTSVIRDIVEVLPNLRHLENGLSTYFQQRLTEIARRLFRTDRVRVRTHYIDPSFLENEAFTKSLRIILNDTTQTLTSLKLRDMQLSFYDKPRAAMIPEFLQHLDLDLRTWRSGMDLASPGYCYLESDPIEDEVRLVGIWRQNLRRLRQLETLRLEVHCGGGRATEYKGMSPSQFHIDDLLVDSDEVDGHYVFPKLKSLVLSNSAVRIRRLLAFIKPHQKTLKKLALTRLSFAPVPELYSQAWPEIANLCKDAVPGLTYLRLSKLVTGRPKRFEYDHSNGLNAEPTPIGWRSGLEDAMTYEWTKGVANGVDQEFIGSKCPWTSADDDDELKDSILPTGSG